MSFEPLESRQMLASGLVISEFLASNDNDLRDEDYQRPDWIEVLNTGAAEANLDGWYLTDDAQELTKWRFPEVNLASGERLVVFASAKDRAMPGAPLHTNFQLRAGGEYLALVEPDGTTVAFDYGPQYPPQIPDVSFGMPQPIGELALVSAATPLRALVPTADDGDALGQSWTAIDFDDSSWTPGVGSVGYEQSSGYEEFIGTDIGPQMFEHNATAYVRLPFTVEDPAAVFSLSLGVQYDDGYVAYLNGTEVARRNAPDDVAWNSVSTVRRRDSEVKQFEDVEMAPFLSLLVPGKNVLAVHALNDDPRSNDFLMAPVLTAGAFGQLQPDQRNYFTFPSAGTPNGLGTTTALVDVAHTPSVPREGEDLTVTARFSSTTGSVLPMTLYYRVMFGDETSVPMMDDGLHGDGAAGDGVFGAMIPAGAVAAPGQVVRYRITAGETSDQFARSPVFREPLEWQEYYGTIVEPPATESKLPVMYWFLEDPEAADTLEGTRGAFFYDGELYDNVQVDVHGFTTKGYPKKSHDIFFPRDHRFRLTDGLPRMKDINALTDYGDRAKVRNTLSYETYRSTGTHAHLAFPIRIQQNNEFLGIYDFVEDGDDEFLEREGLDPRGALYKMDNALDSSVLNLEKKTRTEEDHSDLQALIDGANQSGAERTAFLYDNVSIPEMVNYLVGLVLTGESDCCHRNYYAYRDTEGTGEWQFMPWDVDKSYGRQGTFDDGLHTDTGGIFKGQGNALNTALFETPEIRSMYLRRLRSLLDEWLQPADTPTDQLNIERRIAALVEQLAPDVPLDFDKWGSWGEAPSWEEQLAQLTDVYLPARREILYRAVTQANGGREMPPQVGAPEIQFGDVDFKPASGDQDEEYIQLHNPNDVAVDMSGWQLDGGVQFTFRPGTVIPAGGTLYVSPNVNAFRARQTGPSGGQGLFVQGGYSGHLSPFGETIRLMASDRTVVATVTTPFDPSPAQQYLRVSELMYHPRDPAEGSSHVGDDFEFVELVNISESVTLDLENVAFTDGIQFTFPAALLPPGERIVVVKSPEAFEARYGPDLPIAGPYEGRLADGGERLRMEDAAGGTVFDFIYTDDDPWPERADGAGASLELIDPVGTPRDELGKYYRWRGSAQRDGSPGATSAQPVGVVINEVLTNTAGRADQTDAIELFNATDEAIDIGGWHLSDSGGNPLKFEIPGGTTIPAQGFVVFSEADFNPTPEQPLPQHFALSGTRGDDVWLVVPDGAGGVATFVDDVHFGPAPEGISLGRSPDGSGRLAPMTVVTLGRMNGAPRVGSVMFSEIHFNPVEPSSTIRAIAPDMVRDDFEFVEIYTGGPAVDLSAWQIRGAVDFDFPPGTRVLPGQPLVVLSFDPNDPDNAGRVAAFRAHHRIEGDVALMGGYARQLGDDGDNVQLLDSNQVVVDEVLYDDLPPWPSRTDEFGARQSGGSLSRVSVFAWGNAADGWSVGLPTPGTSDLFAPQPGDSNFDRRFDQRDIVVALQGAAFQTGRPATYGQGDWNGDGYFDEQDLAVALDTGRYMQGPYVDLPL